MSWNELPEEVQAVAMLTLTRKQLDVFKLRLAGCSWGRMVVMLGSPRSTLRTHYESAHARLLIAGVHVREDGSYYRKEAA